MLVEHDKLNVPTVSDPSAMQLFPNARNNERDTLIDYVALHPGMRVLDIQSAGGYLSDEVDRRLGGNVEMVCVEPCAELRGRLNPRFRGLADPVEQFVSLADGSVDLALGLVGLHHSASHAATLGEAFRVLRPGGELAICDVPAGSRLAEWLDIFVGRHCPTGHDGNFPAPGSMANICRAAGFADVSEEVRNVPWLFGSRAEVARFFRGLFGLDLEIERVDAALDDYFELSEADGRCSVAWRLAYCHARKPG